MTGRRRGAPSCRAARPAFPPGAERRPHDKMNQGGVRSGTGNVHQLGKAKRHRRARLRGNIACPALEVYGEVAGEISAEGTVLLHPGARVTGSLRAGQVVLRPGAVLTKAQGGSL